MISLRCIVHTSGTVARARLRRNHIQREKGCRLVAAWVRPTQTIPTGLRGGRFRPHRLRGVLRNFSVRLRPWASKNAIITKRREGVVRRRSCNTIWARPTEVVPTGPRVHLRRP